MHQYSYDNKPTLYIVPTPIGNLEDMTFRAINILKEVEVILAEDTRITLKLMNYFNIKNKLVSNNKDNEYKNVDKIIKCLEVNNKVALVTDRGTPLISDPGNILVKKIVEKGYNVVCLPGATALIPALVDSSLNTDKFLFYGFLNSKENKRKQELETIKNIPYTIIFYEAPHRLLKTLKNVNEIFGNRYISLVKEISKIHEQVIRGKIDDVINSLTDIKGEFVIIVEGSNNPTSLKEIDIEKEYDNYITQGIEKKEAIKKIARKLNVPKNDIYQKIHKRWEEWR